MRSRSLVVLQQQAAYPHAHSASPVRVPHLPATSRAATTDTAIESYRRTTDTCVVTAVRLVRAVLRQLHPHPHHSTTRANVNGRGSSHQRTKRHTRRRKTRQGGGPGSMTKLRCPPAATPTAHSGRSRQVLHMYPPTLLPLVVVQLHLLRHLAVFVRLPIPLHLQL